MYQLLGIDEQIDFGFGITAEAYYEAAECLGKHDVDLKSFQLKALPSNFLYRHSIELALKSLIIIFHKKLKLVYGDESYQSQKPKIQVNAKWIPLYNCHFIDVLYEYWLKGLLLPHIEQLKSLGKDGCWEENAEISRAISLIVEYDRQSSFFRYPVGENDKHELKKYEMQLVVDIGELFKNLNEKASATNPKKFVMALKDSKGEIVRAYVKTENPLEDIGKVLREVASYFNTVHFMSRFALCKMM